MLAASARIAEESSLSISPTIRRQLTKEISLLGQTWRAGSIRRDDPRLGRMIHAIDNDAESVSELAPRLLARLRGSRHSEWVGEQLGRVQEQFNAMNVAYRQVRNLCLPRLRGRLDALSRAASEVQGVLEKLRELQHITIVAQTNLTKELERVAAVSQVALEAAELAPRIRELRDRIAAASRTTLQRELDDVLAAARALPASERNRTIFARHIGLDGNGGCTLDVVAKEFGISRERVRQIGARVVERLGQRKPFAPVLDRALDLVVENVPGDSAQIESNLLSLGITEKAFRLEGLRNIAQLLGREPNFTVVRVGSKRFAVPPSDEGQPHVIAQVARRSVRHWGVTTVADFAAQVARAASHTLSPAWEKLGAVVLQALPDFEWLDPASGWFWLRSVKRNPLLNQIRKILSVAGGVHVSELREGVGRDHRTRGFAPPRRVLLELCRRLDGYRVEGDRVIADPPLDWRKVLGRTEQTLVLALKSRGSSMTRVRLEEICLQRGMKRNTFYTYLDHLSIIKKFAQGVYALRGAEIPAGTVEALAPRRRMGKVLVDYGWTPDRRVWLGYKLSDAMITTGSFNVPKSMKRFAVGEFALKAADGSSVGTAVSKESGAWGLRPFFRRRGGEPGDYLLLVFDLAARVAVVSIGDASLLTHAGEAKNSDGGDRSVD
jgi:hypothetical protein